MLRLIQILVSLLLVGWIVTTIDLAEVGQHLRNTRFDILALSIPVVIANRWLMSAKWNLLLKAQGVILSEWRCFRIYAMSNFVGIFLPATVGADLSRAALAKYEHLPLPTVASSILVERLLGFAALVFMTVVGAALLALFFGDITFSFGSLLGIAGSAMAFFTVAILASFSQPMQRFVAWVLAKLAGFGGVMAKLSAMLEKTYSAYLEYRGHRTTLLVFFVLSCVEGSLLILLAYIVTVALQVEVNFFYLAAFVSIVVFLIRMPISIDGLGIYEKGTQFFLLQVGVSASLGLATGILFHIVCLVALLPGGVLMAFYRRPALSSNHST